MPSTLAVGKIVEDKFVGECLKRGWIPSLPVFPVSYDVVVDTRKDRVRVQVKKGTTNGFVNFTSRRTRATSYRYKPGDFEVLAAYSHTGQWFIIPFDVANAGGGSLYLPNGRPAKFKARVGPYLETWEVIGDPYETC